MFIAPSRLEAWLPSVWLKESDFDFLLFPFFFSSYASSSLLSKLTTPEKRKKEKSKT
jgi:hypothetical protein